MKLSGPLLSLSVAGLLLSACLPIEAPPIGLQATNVNNQLFALQTTQAELNYMATQTPYAATQSAAQTAAVVMAQNQATLSALDAQGTALALQLLADGATATHVANQTQTANSLQMTARADDMTQAAFFANGTATQDSRQATQTQAALDFERKDKINGIIVWTPFVFAGVLGFLLIKYVLIYENRKSAFETPSGEMIFSRNVSIFRAVIRAILRRLLPEISFDDFTMPGRATGHAVRENKEGYAVSKDTDRASQLQIIMLEQLRTRGLSVPSSPFPSLSTGLPELPAYTGLLGEAGEIKVLPPNDPEIITWVTDVEEQD